MMRVAIAGGGAAGVLAAIHLRRRKPDAQITMIDASGRPGTARHTAPTTRRTC